MGTWGVAIFSDDAAADVRDEWRGYLGEGLSGQQATDKLLKSWSASLDDPDDGPVFWLALAAAQWPASGSGARLHLGSDVAGSHSGPRP